MVSTPSANKHWIIASAPVIFFFFSCVPSSFSSMGCFTFIMFYKLNWSVTHPSLAEDTKAAYFLRYPLDALRGGATQFFLLFSIFFSLRFASILFSSALMIFSSPFFYHVFF